MNPGEYFDDRTGTIKAEGKLRSAAKIAMKPTPAPEPVKPKFPKCAMPDDMVDHQHQASGTIPRASSEDIVRQNVEKAHGRVLKVAPARADAALAKVANGIREVDEGIREITAANTAVGETIEAVVVCGDLQAERQSKRDSLGRAEAIDASPKCLEMPDSELVRLKAELKHLPTVVRELDQKIEAATAKVKSLIANNQIDPAALMDLILTEAKGDGLRPDTHVLQLHSRGFLTV